MLSLIKDNKGFLSLINAILSIFLIFIVLISFNMIVDMEMPSLSEDNNQFKTSQDLMELMSSKIDGRDYSTLERISYVLSSNDNSIASRREVKNILDDFFSAHLGSDYKYVFIETNQLNGYVLSFDGDYSTADEVSLAIRNYGNYSYKLYIFKA